ncbi:Asp-tRNA(Asn)/Glu-tRNA(Gln) amidotransferase subunit GatA [Candidatus Peregrinibacteria bacterium]|nr:Asp-tRNA(Asn)/Glu-tRNA(Gln) amidotransferase subunit GatA [Candidatus Peregrinibacteria bacterium]
MSLSTLTIHEAAAGLRAKKFSSVELTKACLERIKKLEPTVKAFTLVTEETALEQARQADKTLNPQPSTPNHLHGIPVALKDVFCTEGIRTTACSNILKNFVPPYDATAVKRLKAVGMVLLGKTNTDEFTCGASTETSCFGTSKNPWDPARTPGGSSGGSAAAVASDECIYALGTDTGGSIRQPAAYCGITGLKVTYGRVSRFGVISMASSLDTIGPMAKDVEDAAIIMNVIAGHDEYDSTTPEVKVPDYTESLQAKDLKGLRIGLPKEYFIPGMDPEVEAFVRQAVEQLKKLGATVREISLPHSKYGLAVYYVLCPSEVSANMARYDGIRYGPGPSKEGEDLYEYYLNSRGEGFGDEMKRRIMIGTYALSSGYYDAYYLKAQKVRTLVKRDFEKAFKEVDVIVTPTTPATAFKIGENSADPVKMYLEDIFTVSVNIAGMPALAIPCGISKAGLPIGMQIIGPQFEEPRLLKVGAAFQRVTDWHKKKPMQIPTPS